MIKFKTTFNHLSIIEVEIDRETKKFVVFKDGKRESKVGDYEIYHNKWEEAYLYLKKREEKSLALSQLYVAQAEERLKELANLKILVDSVNAAKTSNHGEDL